MFLNFSNKKNKFKMNLCRCFLCSNAIINSNNGIIGSRLTNHELIEKWSIIFYRCKSEI